MLMCMAYLNQILPISSTVEGVEVTRRVSMWSWFGKNTTYRCSYIACTCVFTVFEKLVAAYLYRICISHVRACTHNLYTHELTQWCVEEFTHTQTMLDTAMAVLYLLRAWRSMMYSIRRHAGITNYESGCILQSSMTHHVVSIVTEFR